MNEIDTVRAIYQRFSAGDLDGVIALCADDIEWVVNGPAHLEKCRAFAGTTGVREFFAILGRTWNFTAFEAREFIAAGSKVVVLGDEKGSDCMTGEPFNNRWAHVFVVADGKIQSFREFLCHWPGDTVPPPMAWY